MRRLSARSETISAGYRVHAGHSIGSLLAIHLGLLHPRGVDRHLHLLARYVRNVP